MNVSVFGRRLGRRSLAAAAPVGVVAASGIGAAVTKVAQVIRPGSALAALSYEPQTHRVTLVAQRLDAQTLAYNGSVPGPTLEIVEGDTVEVTFRNGLDVDCSVHVHGVHYDIHSDGTRHTHSFAPPGGTYQYRWTAAPGTAGYWHYHDHLVGGDHGTAGIEQGLYGALIVRKPGEPRPDRTFVLFMVQDTFNGKRAPETPLLVAREGERVEFVVVTHINMFHTFHLHGHRWLHEGGSRVIDTFTQGPAESTGFVVTAGEGVGPGDWMYHCHVHNHSDSGMAGVFRVLPPGAAEDAPVSDFLSGQGISHLGH